MASCRSSSSDSSHHPPLPIRLLLLLLFLAQMLVSSICSSPPLNPLFLIQFQLTPSSTSSAHSSTTMKSGATKIDSVYRLSPPPAPPDPNSLPTPHLKPSSQRPAPTPFAFSSLLAKKSGAQGKQPTDGVAGPAVLQVHAGKDPFTSAHTAGDPKLLIRVGSGLQLDAGGAAAARGSADSAIEAKFHGAGPAIGGGCQADVQDEAQSAANYSAHIVALTKGNGRDNRELVVQAAAPAFKAPRAP